MAVGTFNGNSWKGCMKYLKTSGGDAAILQDIGLLGGDPLARAQHDAAGMG